jgi:hypothetical protein
MLAFRASASSPFPRGGSNRYSNSYRQSSRGWRTCQRQNSAYWQHKPVWEALKAASVCLPIGHQVKIALTGHKTL